MRERDDDQILVLVGRLGRSFDRHGRVQPPLPRVEPREPIGGGRRSLVGDVVRDARERVDRRHVRAHRRRQQPRRHGKILVMRPGQRLARRVGAREVGM